MKHLYNTLLLIGTLFFLNTAFTQSCDTLRNYSLSDNFYEISGANGAALGHDKVNGGASNVEQWAEPYNVAGPIEVRRLRFVPWLVHDEGGDVIFHVYNDNAGTPGASVASDTIPIADFSENTFYQLDFTNPASVNGDFFVGYELAYNTPQDSFAILGTHKPGGVNYTQLYFDGAWDDADNIYTIGTDPFISAWRLDVMVSNAPAPVADYNSNSTACLSGVFEPDASITTNTDQYEWILWDAAIQNVQDQQTGITPTVNPAQVENDQVLALYADGGCMTDVQAYLVDVFPDISANVTTTNTTCELDNGSIEVTNPSGGSGNYSYSDDNGTSYQSNPLFSNEAAGTYDVVVASGGNGCSATYPVTVGATPKETVTGGSDQTICKNDNATITASGNGTIEWFDGTTSVGTGTSITVSPVATTSYDAVLTDANNCEDTAQVVVNVNPLPAISAGTDDAICDGDSYTLNASGGSTYSWDNGLGAGASHTVSPAATTTYQVTGTDGNGCQNTDDITITVNTLPTITASADATICSGQTETISATGGSTYSWDNGLGAGSSQNVTPTATTTYEVTGTDANGCQGTDQVTINVDPLPTVSAGTDAAICDGDNTTITASGADTYVWDNGLGAGVSHQVSPASTTVYEVTGTDANGCENTATVEITVNQIDDASFTFNNFCEAATSNGPTNIATTGGSFAFNPVPTDGATIDASTGEITDGVAGTTYSVEYTTNGTCPNSSVETVTVQTDDDPSFTYDDICLGNGQPIAPTNIATPGGTFDFVTTPADGATIDASTGTISNPTVGSTYNVEYTTPSGVCQNSSNTTVDVLNAPTITASGDQTICEQNAVTVSATGGDTYNWNNGVGAGASHSVTPTTTTTYTVTGTGVNGCTNTDDVVITVNPLPAVDAGSDQTVCEQETVNISASGASTFNWDNGLGTGATQTFTATATTTYTVTGTDANGCSNTDDLTITVDPLPAIDAGADQSICAGEQTTITATGGNTYNWDNSLGAGAAHNISPASTTTYEVTGTDLNGCENTDQLTVTVNAVPTINAGVDQEVCEGDEVTLSATVSNGAVSWDNGIDDGVPFTASTTTTYTATVNDNGCTATDEVVVTVNPLPIVSVGDDETTCINYEPIQLSGSPSGGTFSGDGVTNNTFDPEDAGVGTHTVTYTFQDGNGCENTATQQITVDGCAGIAENAIANEYHIFPNPAADYFEIKAPHTIDQVSVLNALGKTIENVNITQIEDNHVMVTTRALAPGTYFVKLRSQQHDTVKKIIVK
ncbi:MAG: T9SS type A sorting domain-containing protein [Bacteroidota bacterium]